jgi:hypothetical protein
MLISSLLVLCLGILTTTTTVFAQTGPQECSTTISDEDKTEMETTVAAVNLARRQTSTYEFGIYFTVVAANTTEAGGWVPQKQIDDQITLLNARFASTGTRIRFRLLNVTRIVNRNWHDNVDSGNALSTAMKRALHKGRSVHLNIYAVGLTNSDANGYSTFPVSYATNPTQDGIVLKFTTVPGGSSTIRQGGTLVHETGHWLGLFHTFQGGCTGTGDNVADTPAEAEPAYGCPIGRDSCPLSRLPDPIHNFMDYTDETCRTEFTAGQISLMHRSIAAFRSNPNL